MAEEQVAVLDEAGAVIGVRPRSEVRRHNLRHAATAVLLRRSDGRIHVHRRSPDKDWQPSVHDAAAGGVLKAGEEPDPAAVRELAEELGVTGVPLTPLFTLRYDEGNGGLRSHLFAFEARHDGPVHHQPEEVADGGWMPLPELRARLADPAWPFVPDGRLLIERWFACASELPG